MKLSKSFKYSLLSFMALASLGVTLNSATTTAHAMGGEYDDSKDVTWAPESNGSFTPKSTGSSVGSMGYSDGMRAYTKKGSTVFQFNNVGKDPNEDSKGKHRQIDMRAKLTNMSTHIKYVGVKTNNGISINMFTSNGATNYTRSMDVTFTFYYHGTNTQVQWDNDVIGLAFSDLEPARLGIKGMKPKMADSFDQSVKSITDTFKWNPWSSSIGKDTWINRGDASNGLFHMKNSLSFPKNLPKGGGKGYDPRTGGFVNEPGGKDNPLYLHSIWNKYETRDLNPAIHYSGAIGEYKANGTKSIKVHLKGSSIGNDEFVFSGAKVYPKKLTKSSISKSITYNGKTTKANTLKDKDDPMVYNINATVSAKKGAYITDALPKRFTVTKISSVTNFSHNSVADVNATHQFKATLKNDKLDGKNKKVTFHITGNMGNYMAKHPNVALKWPVANTAYWYQKQAASFC